VSDEEDAGTREAAPGAKEVEGKEEVGGTVPAIPSLPQHGKIDLVAKGISNDVVSLGKNDCTLAPTPSWAAARWSPWLHVNEALSAWPKKKCANSNNSTLVVVMYVIARDFVACL
jgi:hypothetical protein